MLKQIEIDEIVPLTPATTPTNLVPTVGGGPMTPPVVADLKDLTLRLVSRKAAVRTEAERQLRNIDVSTLLALMDYQRRMHKQMEQARIELEGHLLATEQSRLPVPRCIIIHHGSINLPGDLVRSVSYVFVTSILPKA